MIVETHTDPTGSLQLAVERNDEGLISIGFVGFPWHTHPELLVGEYGPTNDAALEAFKHAIMGDKLIIAIIWHERQAVAVSVSDDPLSEHEYLSDGEELELRYWSGRRWLSSDPRAN